MKKIFQMIPVVLFFIVMLLGCQMSIDGKNYHSDDKTTQQEKNDAAINWFFWGEWQRMDNGVSYVINEKSVLVDEKEYNIKLSSAKTLIVQELGTFEKQTDSVMINNSIPYFRKGGTNLSYTMKLVGFEDSVSRFARTASNVSLPGYTVTGRSDQYESFTSKSISDTNGVVILTAPTAGDVQTVTVSKGDSKVVVVHGIKVETNGSNMGTIPISEEGQYSLKVTGIIDESKKDDGYLFGNNYRKYPLILTIANVSDVTSAPSVCTITGENSLVQVSASDGSDISDGVLISTLKPGFTKTINLLVSCGNMTDDYIDTGLLVTIKNAVTEKTWQDFVPLRFFKGLLPITVAAESVEENTDAALNGFVIYPDGNSQFFSVPNGGYRTINVPSFGYLQEFMLAFSGATIEGTLSNSTEMLYTVAIGTRTKKEIDRSGNAFIEAVHYGESDNGNGTEDNAFSTESYFEAYLADGDVDFFSMPANSTELKMPDGSVYYTLDYVGEGSSSLLPVLMKSGEKLDESKLPELSRDYYDFAGWYIGSEKITPYSYYGIYSNITLTAKWTPSIYSITYELNGGTNAKGNPVKYTIESESITLSEPTRNGYEFAGWYEDADFTGSEITTIAAESTGNRKLYAKWSPITYSISYTLNGGTNNSVNPTSYTVESETIILSNPTRPGCTFAGWYASSSFTGIKVTKIDAGSCGNKIVYAKWTPINYSITYNLNDGINNVLNPASYTVESDTIILENPTKTNYTFKGWYVSSSFTGEKVTKIETGSTENKILYAKWFPTTYSITYNLSGGINNSSNPESYTIESETVTLLEPIRSGYEFVNWYATEDFTGNAVETIEAGSTGDVTLYALWLDVEQYIVIASDMLNSLDLSTLTKEKTLLVKGKINNDTLGTIASKILYASENINLDLSYTTGLTAISGQSTWSIFQDCNHLKSIFLPNTLKTIGSYSFFNCKNLTDVTIPDSVTSIGNSAFENCSSLTSVTIGKSVTCIGDYAFRSCSSLTSVMIPDSVTSIGNSAFEHCSSLTSVTIGKSVTSIGNSAFEYCSSLTSVTIPESVTRIGRYAFSSCSSLTSVIFDDTLTWYYTSRSDSTNGTSISVIDVSKNASLLRSTYNNCYWYKK